VLTSPTSAREALGSSLKPAEPARFVPLSTAEAVLRYASDFVSSWAGAAHGFGILI
jgi:hypothetical protein